MSSPSHAPSEAFFPTGVKTAELGDHEVVEGDRLFTESIMPLFDKPHATFQTDATGNTALVTTEAIDHHSVIFADAATIFVSLNHVRGTRGRLRTFVDPRAADPEKNGPIISEAAQAQQLLLQLEVNLACSEEAPLDLVEWIFAGKSPSADYVYKIRPLRNVVPGSDADAWRPEDLLRIPAAHRERLSCPSALVAHVKTVLMTKVVPCYSAFSYTRYAQAYFPSLARTLGLPGVANAAYVCHQNVAIVYATEDLPKGTRVCVSVTLAPHALPISAQGQLLDRLHWTETPLAEQMAVNHEGHMISVLDQLRAHDAPIHPVCDLYLQVDALINPSTPATLPPADSVLNPDYVGACECVWAFLQTEEGKAMAPTYMNDDNDDNNEGAPAPTTESALVVASAKNKTAPIAELPGAVKSSEAGKAPAKHVNDDDPCLLLCEVIGMALGLLYVGRDVIGNHCWRKLYLHLQNCSWMIELLCATPRGALVASGIDATAALMMFSEVVPEPIPERHSGITFDLEYKRDTDLIQYIFAGIQGPLLKENLVLRMAISQVSQLDSARRIANNAVIRTVAKKHGVAKKPTVGTEEKGEEDEEKKKEEKQ